MQGKGSQHSSSVAAPCVAVLLAAGRHGLAGLSDTPRLDAELLLCLAAGLTRAGVLAFPERPIAAQQVADYNALLQRRGRGEPLAYLMGRKEFYSLELAVDAGVLVPRPETELLADVLLEYLRPEQAARVLDLGTGSGALALAIKAERPSTQVLASDVSPLAISIARANARRHGLDITCLESDWFEALAGQRFDYMLCNPPYVPSADPQLHGPLQFEPRLALDGGADGLDAIREVLKGAKVALAPGGRLLLEHGYDQQDGVVSLATRHGYDIVARHSDLGGRPRLVVVEVCEL